MSPRKDALVSDRSSTVNMQERHQVLNRNDLLAATGT